MEHLLRRRRLVIAFAAAAVLALGACTSQRTEPRPAASLVVAACNPAFCNISDAVWQHIEMRHCQGCVVNDKSAFVAGYCGSKANAVSFCQALMGRPNCAGVQQVNNRVAYSADFAAVIGSTRTACNDTVRGTVIYDTNTSAVVTQFPGNP